MKAICCICHKQIDVSLDDWNAVVESEHTTRPLSFVCPDCEGQLADDAIDEEYWTPERIVEFEIKEERMRRKLIGVE